MFQLYKEKDKKCLVYGGMWKKIACLSPEIQRKLLEKNEIIFLSRRSI